MTLTPITQSPPGSFFSRSKIIQITNTATNHKLYYLYPRVFEVNFTVYKWMEKRQFHQCICSFKNDVKLIYNFEFNRLFTSTPPLPRHLIPRQIIKFRRDSQHENNGEDGQCPQFGQGISSTRCVGFREHVSKVYYQIEVNKQLCE